jgi:hypothetical protein
MLTKLFSENLKGRQHLENLDFDGITKLKRILRTLQLCDGTSEGRYRSFQRNNLKGTECDGEK